MRRKERQACQENVIIQALAGDNLVFVVVDYKSDRQGESEKDGMRCEEETYQNHKTQKFSKYN